MPVGSVFKHINGNDLNFRKTDNWESLTGFELTMNLAGKAESYFMIIYNFSMKLSSKAVFQSRFSIDGAFVKVKYH